MITPDIIAQLMEHELSDPAAKDLSIEAAVALETEKRLAAEHEYARKQWVTMSMTQELITVMQRGINDLQAQIGPMLYTKHDRKAAMISAQRDTLQRMLNYINGESKELLQ